MCQATKGATDMSLCFTDISQGAAWRSTFLQSNPWVVKPPYADLIGFELAMVMPDLLHVFNLGVCRDVIGCVLKTVIKEQYVFSWVGHRRTFPFSNKFPSLLC
jgi:hypothetical protein